MGTILLYVLFAAVGYFFGTFAWSQIVGVILAAGLAIKDLKEINAPAFIIELAMCTARKYRSAVVIWSLILVALTFVAFHFFKSYAWLYIAGLGVSLVAVIKSIPSLKNEFLSNIGINRSDSEQV